MYPRFIFLFLFIFCFCIASFSQKEDSSKIVSGNKYFRSYYSNDAWFLTDYYFTQGLRGEWIFPVFSKFPLRKILPSLRNSVNYYGASAVIEAYTPTSIPDPDIRFGDRPYAGLFYLGQMLISNSSQKKIRLTSEAMIGLIGPPTAMGWFQKEIHIVLNSPQPKGWRHEIDTDLLLHYFFKVEKGLVTIPDVTELIVFSEANVGTLHDNIAGGGLLRVGFLNAYFNNLGFAKKSTPEGKANHRFQLYAFFKYKGKLVGHNTIMQGGLLNRQSPYIIRSDQLERLVLENTAGLFISYGTLSLEAASVWLTPEFKTGLPHQYGMLNFGFCF